MQGCTLIHYLPLINHAHILHSFGRITYNDWFLVNIEPAQPLTVHITQLHYTFSTDLTTHVTIDHSGKNTAHVKKSVAIAVHRSAMLLLLAETWLWRYTKKTVSTGSSLTQH